MDTHTLAYLVQAGGVLQLGVLGAATLVPGRLDWRGELRKVSPFLRQLVWVYGGFIALIVAAFGLGSLLLADELVAATPLARAACGFIGVFWSVRLAVALFVFDARPLLTNGWLRLGYAVLTATFVYLSFAYTFVAFAAGA